MANGEVTTGKVIALIRALSTSSTSSATYTVTDALVIGAATTSGVRLDVSSGTLRVREGDNSDNGYIYANQVFGANAVRNGCTITGGTPVSMLYNLGVITRSGLQYLWSNNASSADQPADTGLARDAAAQIVVTDGTTGVGNLRATALIVGTNGQGTRTSVLTASSALTSGASYTFTGALPDGAIILGVSARITTTVTGPTSVQVGDGSDADRYGIFSTLTANQTLTPADGTASPLEWRSAAGDVVLTAVGGNFTAGVIKIAVHYAALAAPTS